MATTMTPSELSDGQIAKFSEAYAALLRKHRNELGSDEAQQVLGSPQYLQAQLGVVRKFIEAVSSLIRRLVSVNRERAPEAAIAATNRKQYVTASVVKTMPRGEGSEEEIILFKVGCDLTDEELKQEYELRGLVPASPFGLAALNESDPAFADDHPNATVWIDSEGKWCYAAFYRWDDDRSVNVYRGDDDWGDGWFFAGLRK